MRTTTLLTTLLEEFELIRIQDQIMTENIFNQHYAEHSEKSFFAGLKEAMVGKTVIAIILEGTHAGQIRAACEDIRAVYVDTDYIGPRNLVHCSDSEEAALREIKIWFAE